MIPQIEIAKLLSRIDHLVYATPDLDTAVAKMERLLGVRATTGGIHPNWGTRNALLTLGPRCYLEIIAPNPGRQSPPQGRPFGLDRLETARLVGWAANSANLEADRASAIQSGLLLGPVLSGDRLRADGTRLSWRLTNLRSVAFDGVAPILIDWGESRHPASTAAHGATLISLCAEHPAAETVRVRLAACGLPLPVTECPMPALIATIDCPNGRVEIR